MRYVLYALVLGCSIGCLLGAAAAIDAWAPMALRHPLALVASMLTLVVFGLGIWAVDVLTLGGAE